MGIFDSGIEFNKLATNVSKIRLLLDEIEIKVYSIESAYESRDDYYFIAYICRVGIIDRMAKFNWGLSTKIRIAINGISTRVSLQEAYVMSISRLSILSQINSLVAETVSDILDKGNQFYYLDSQIPVDVKKKI